MTSQDLEICVCDKYGYRERNSFVVVVKTEPWIFPTPVKQAVLEALMHLSDFT